jgi:hypothetical protein
MSFNTAVEKIVLYGPDAAVSRAGAGGVPVNISMLSIAPGDEADMDEDTLSAHEPSSRTGHDAFLRE